jgi:hypothetical protein
MAPARRTVFGVPAIIMMSPITTRRPEIIQPVTVSAVDWDPVPVGELVAAGLPRAVASSFERRGVKGLDDPKRDESRTGEIEIGRAELDDAELVLDSGEAVEGDGAATATPRRRGS